MVRFRKRMLAPINSNKHYVHRTNVQLASGAIQNNVIVDAVVAPATGNAFDVEEGSVVKAVYIEIWLASAGAAAATNQFSLTVEKLPNNLVAMTFAQSANLGAYTNKKNILYTTQGVLVSAASGTTSIPIIRQYILIPKGKQRMGLSDRLMVNISATGQPLNICGIFTYKEYR